MKILKRILLALAILIVATVVIFNQNIPAFIYNELEWRARANYLLSEQIRSDVDFLIAIRTGKEEVFISDQVKWDKLMEDIEKGLDLVLKLTDDYLTLLHRQDRIPLLPAKYKKYQELKKPALENYQKGLLIFREVKEKEHKGFRLVRQADFAYQKFSSGSQGLSDEEYFANLTDAVEVARSLNNEAEKLYQQRVIDKGFRDYVVFQNQKMIDFYEVILDPKNLEDEIKLANKLEAISQRKLDVEFNEVVANWHVECIDDLNEEMLDYKESAYEQMMKADQYYRENNLKNDLISRLLSRFSEKYPKNI